MAQSPPSGYFLWVLLLSVPFYVWGVYWPVRGLPFGLPATVVMIVLPATVASLFTWKESGPHGVRQLWRRIVDVERIKSLRWILAALLCVPVDTLVAYVTMRILGLPLPTHVAGPFLSAPLMFVIYFLGAIPEEIGWTGYATETLQSRYGVFRTGLTIGVVWAGWHVVPWWLGQGHALSWVAGQVLLTIVMRIMMGWIYSSGGRSLFLALVFHAMINTSFSLFPNNGSHYNPWVLAAVVSVILMLAMHSTRSLTPSSMRPDGLRGSAPGPLPTSLARQREPAG